MSHLRKVLFAFCGAFLLLLTILLVRAAFVEDPLEVVEAPDVEISFAGTEGRLSEAIQLPTISLTEQGADRQAFLGFQQLLEEHFPVVHDEATRELVNELTLHFEIAGEDPDRPHVVLLAHYDVVPATEAADWTYPPFSGTIADGFIWGRGTLDNKQNVMAILEAAEDFLRSGNRPAHTLHLVFGHDEEIGGYEGARKVAETLARRGVEVVAVYDEGLIISEDLVPGVQGPVALVGITERGIANFEIEARAPGGHASMPPQDLAVIRLSKALQNLHENPMKASLEGPTSEMIRYALPEMNFGYRLLFRNRWLFEPVIVSQMAASPSTNAVIRTTAAPTMLEASPRHNILPQSARATLNFRIHPRDSIASVQEYLEELFADQDYITVRLSGEIQTEPSPIASLDGPGFKALQRALEAVYPEARIAPNMLVAFSDSRHFTDLTHDIYRFQPILLAGADLQRIHGNDERISINSYHRLILYYRALLSLW